MQTMDLTECKKPYYPESQTVMSCLAICGCYYLVTLRNECKA